MNSQLPALRLNLKTPAKHRQTGLQGRTHEANAASLSHRRLIW
jgi:hypothetical protein